MHIISLLVDPVLAGYVVYEVARFLPQYRQLKQAIAKGDARARMRVYQSAIVFEWVSAVLALLALGFEWNKLNPKSLGLDGSRLMRLASRSGEFDRSALTGIFFGIALGTIGIVIARLRLNRQGSTPAPDAPPRWWRKLVPDFSALIPTTMQERFLWVVVAISAGVCEEIVFRGWLLSTLHDPLRLHGTALVVVAAVIFGLAHAYQGVTGVVVTTLAGALFCGLYVATGSLLAPSLLHVLIDVRFAVLPAPRCANPRTIYA